ncbi:cob(I)yrinic acid a,c-diamide adenosyltransferase [Candidatus Mycoplasma mahonii]|uniref:cob(I)yrinic acid a,c-diamide adenosyltransferase n=1 Tax=Candidatus Mycoplasma mahonii TaxID=3004105 RepID=UPI0026EFC951|nr:cob(I)yrinic acid a,c-diamide adenosyltransferase [Candidatus Mycoplasma mahonii]WKX02410.1 cob(I)yrinic acid a,c-diamide adenosyltransferase [Candidatus Mycoplasma mahonii]
MKHIYRGLGKGKTSCLNESTIRAKEADLNVATFRFWKERATSENAKLEKLDILIFMCQKSKKFVLQMEPLVRLKELDNTMMFLKFIKMNVDKYDVIMLDEIIDLYAHNVNFMTENPLGNKEILMPGHTKLDKLFKNVDLITEFKPTKHYFEKEVGL